tara:strand:+ start:413 stop:799 length:387 start_codon:yes stop_codon:yes gene_type:complete
MKTKNDIIQEWESIITDIIQDVKEYDFKEHDWSDFIVGRDKDNFIDKVNDLIWESIDGYQDVIYTYNAKEISGIIGTYNCFDKWDLTGEQFKNWSQCAFANIYDLIQENICIDELIRQELINNTLQLS